MGDVGIISVPHTLHGRRFVIGKAVANYQRLRTVLSRLPGRRRSNRSGRYEFIFGNNAETVHFENGLRMKLDPTRVFFTCDLTGERRRLSDEVKDDEDVFCPYAGIGGFPLALARKRQCRVHAVEQDPVACSFFRWNIASNRLAGDISLVEGDAHDIKPQMNYDRAVAPLPWDDEPRIGWLLGHLRHGGIAHVYLPVLTGEEDDLKHRLEDLFDVEIVGIHRRGNVAPNRWRVVVDMRVP